MIYIITGKLGAGKSLCAVQQAINYAAEGRRVACNFSIDFSPIAKNPLSKLSNCTPIVLPPIPSSSDLHSLGIGGEFEDTAGGLFLDECAQFLNSRSWNGPDREKVINWFIHARKLKWDVFFIVQHERMLDKQIRDALAEYLVVVRRTDRMKIPFLPMKLPRMHIGVVRYGLEANAMIADRWVTRGTEPMQCYNTHEIFKDTEVGSYSQLPASTIHKWYSPIKVNYTPTLALQIIVYLIVRFISPRSLPIIYKAAKQQLTVQYL